MTLSETGIAALKPPTKGRRLIFDDHRDSPKGFGVRVTAGGGRAFVLRYKHEGSDRLLTIGEHGKNKWSLAAARKRAGELRREIDAGVDILEKRREERAASTVDDIYRLYADKRLKKLSSAKDIKQMLDKHLIPAMGRKKIARVTRADVIELVEKVAADHPRQAGKLLHYIKALFAFAENRDKLQGNVVATLKAKDIDELSLTAQSRERVLSNDELKSFWENIEGCGMHKLTALALKLILVTGQRPGEVAAMRHDEIEGDLWIIPGHRRKKNDANVVPLTDIAFSIIEAAKAESDRLAERRTKQSAGYVFEARPGAPLTVAGMSKAVKRYTEALNNQSVPVWGNWRPHDLRRTCRTGLAAAGVGELIAELVIGHKIKGISSVYNLHSYDAEKRTALEAWERRLLRIVEGELPDDNVTPIKRTA